MKIPETEILETQNEMTVIGGEIFTRAESAGNLTFHEPQTRAPASEKRVILEWQS
jgi:hypothetical protein